MAHLKKIQDHYTNEVTEPNPADRQGLFTGLEAALQRNMMKMELLKPTVRHSTTGPYATGGPHKPVVSPAVNGPGRVKQLIDFHEKQIKNVTAIDKQGKLIIKFRLWLFRQGAVLTPNGKIVWGKSEATVKYDTELEQQNLSKITIRNGLLYQSDGNLLDTTRMVTAASGPGWCIYVMSAENNIHVSSHAVGKRHHSSLLAAANVACAGEMRVIKGRLTHLSNKSGHYVPEAVYLTQVVRVLAQAGVQEESYAIKEYRAGRVIIPYRTALEFMATQVVPVWPANDIDTLFIPNPRLNAMPNPLMNGEVRQALNQDHRERLNEQGGNDAQGTYYDKVYGDYDNVYGDYDNPYDDLI